MVNHTDNFHLFYITMLNRIVNGITNWLFVKHAQSLLIVVIMAIRLVLKDSCSTT